MADYDETGKSLKKPPNPDSDKTPSPPKKHSSPFNAIMKMLGFNDVNFDTDFFARRRYSGERKATREFRHMLDEATEAAKSATNLAEAKINFDIAIDELDHTDEIVTHARTQSRMLRERENLANEIDLERQKRRQAKLQRKGTDTGKVKKEDDLLSPEIKEFQAEAKKDIQFKAGQHLIFEAAKKNKQAQADQGTLTPELEKVIDDEAQAQIEILRLHIYNSGTS